MPNSAVTTIDAYIAGFPPDVRRVLEEVRVAIPESSLLLLKRHDQVCDTDFYAEWEPGAFWSV